MRTGRPTTDKKDKVVKVRVSEKMYKEIEIEAKKTGKSISEIIRECIRMSI